MKTFETISEVFGWLKIAISPALIGIILGCVIYFNVKGRVGMALGISVALIGIIIGIVWATSVWKKRGTIQFLSRTMATPELDNRDEDSETKS